eukprot:sb/3469022/
MSTVSKSASIALNCAPHCGIAWHTIPENAVWRHHTPFDSTVRSDRVGGAIHLRTEPGYAHHDYLQLWLMQLWLIESMSHRCIQLWLIDSMSHSCMSHSCRTVWILQTGVALEALQVFTVWRRRPDLSALSNQMGYGAAIQRFQELCATQFRNQNWGDRTDRKSIRICFHVFSVPLSVSDLYVPLSVPLSDVTPLVASSCLALVIRDTYYMCHAVTLTIWCHISVKFALDIHTRAKTIIQGL